MELKLKEKQSGCRLVALPCLSSCKGAHPLCSSKPDPKVLSISFQPFEHWTVRKAAGEGHAPGTSVAFHLSSSLSSARLFPSPCCVWLMHFLRGWPCTDQSMTWPSDKQLLALWLYPKWTISQRSSSPLVSLTRDGFSRNLLWCPPFLNQERTTLLHSLPGSFFEPWRKALKQHRACWAPTTSSKIQINSMDRAWL